MEIYSSRRFSCDGVPHGLRTLPDMRHCSFKRVTSCALAHASFTPAVLQVRPYSETKWVFKCYLWLYC
jgi:hypothetical protein